MGLTKFLTLGLAVSLMGLNMARGGVAVQTQALLLGIGLACLAIVSLDKR